jgi:methionyl-tRNA formyltransferase
MRSIYTRRPFRARVLGAGQIFEDVIDSLRVAGCEVYFDKQDTGRKIVDLLVLANYTRIIRPAEIARYRLGAVCFHPSMLPRHRGRDAVYWTMEMGDTETGATWFWLDEGIDTGPIAIQAAVKIPIVISRGTLYYSILAPLGAVLFSQLLHDLLRGERPEMPQDESLATYEPPRPKPPIIVTSDRTTVSVTHVTFSDSTTTILTAGAPLAG